MTIRTRSWRALALAAVGSLLLAGCGGQPAPHGRVSVALVLGLTANPFMQEVTAGSTDAAADLGADLTVTGPPAPDPTQGVSMLSRVVAQGVDGVTIMPLPATLWTKGITDAAAATKVNIINTLPVQGIRGAETYVGINDAAASNALMDHLAALLPAGAHGSIVLGSCIPGVAALDTRTNAYVHYIQQKLPGVTVVGPITTTTDAANNLGAWTQAFFAHPDALAFVGNCDSDGNSLARMHADNPGNYLTATFDVDPSTLTGVKDGHLTVAVDEAPYVRGYLATAALVRQAQGQPPITGFVDVKGVLVTRDNVGQIIAREASPASIRAGFTPMLQNFLDDPRGADGPVVVEPIGNAYAGAAV